MSGLAKIFLVINFVLAVLFLGTSATLFSVRKDWKSACLKLQDEYEQKFDQQLKKINLLENKLEVWTNFASVQHAEILNLRRENQKLSTELDQTKSELAATKTELDKSKATVAQQNTEITNLSGKVQSLAAILQEAQKKAEEANKRAVAAEQNANQNFIEKANLEEQYKQVLAELQKVRRENEQLRIRNEILVKYGSAGVAVPRIEGKVEAVKGDIVILSVGEESKVQPGMVFTISRGSTYLGDVKVDRVYKQMSGGRIVYLRKGQEIRRGDDAITKQF